jgi:hypothetical protein
MPPVVLLFNRLLARVVRVVLWLFAVALALVLLAVGLVLVLAVVLWALLRGQRPTAPVFVGRFQRYAQDRVWPGRNGAGGTPADVVDVEARDVNGPRLPPGP